MKTALKASSVPILLCQKTCLPSSTAFQQVRTPVSQLALRIQNVHSLAQPTTLPPEPPPSQSRGSPSSEKPQLQWQTYTIRRFEPMPAEAPAMSPPQPASAPRPLALVVGQAAVEPKADSTPTFPALRKPSVSFYMRELPLQHLVGYDTPEGKEIFKDALMSGGLEAFFPLSQQFLTQEEPAYCGIGTLCMILNALKIDPAKTWKKPWRWFTQEMLDCCRPLEYVRQNGITLSEFTCLARCNGLRAKTKYAGKVTIEEFKEDIIACTSSSNQFMAVSYSRAALGQTGSGHFSPVGGYSDKNGGKVLILDVARFKYPSYWVPLQLLYESLLPPDSVTQQPRGYCILRKTPSSIPSSLLRLNFTKASWPSFFKAITASIAEAMSYEDFVSILLTSIEGASSKSSIFPIANRLAEIQKGSSNPPNASSESQASYDPALASEAFQEYNSAFDSFLVHVCSKSSLYPLLALLSPMKLQEQQSMLTIFLLGLFSSEAFLKAIKSETLREEVRRRAEEEFIDGKIKKESEIIREQMESLEDCCREECGIECREKGKCGKTEVS